MKKVLVVAATTLEIDPFLQFLKASLGQKGNPLFGMNGYEIDVLITGVGIANTAYKLGKAVATKHYHFILNVGIAGSFKPDILRGSVVEIMSEQYGDLGVEEADGTFTDIHELNLIGSNEVPFIKAKLLNKKPLNIKKINKVSGLTVQKVHGFGISIASIVKKYNCDIETMEGAVVFQICLTEKIDFSQIRAISNHVEPRNKDNWQIKEAIENLNKVVIELFEKRII